MSEENLNPGQFYWTRKNLDEATGDQVSEDDSAKMLRDGGARRSYDTDFGLYEKLPESATGQTTPGTVTGKDHGAMYVSWGRKGGGDRYMKHLDMTGDATKHTDAEGNPTMVDHRILDTAWEAEKEGRDSVVSAAVFTQRGARLFPQALGMAVKQHAEERSFGNLVPDSSLSEHSGAIVDRLANAGLVSDSQRLGAPDVDLNDFDYLPEPSDEDVSLRTNSSLSDVVPRSEARAGSRHIAKILRSAREDKKK